RKRVRQQGGGRGHPGDGSRSGDPVAVDPQGAARLRQGSVQGSQPGGALLAEGQAVPSRGDPLREDREELSGFRTSRLPYGLAPLTARNLSTRPTASDLYKDPIEFCKPLWDMAL